MDHDMAVPLVAARKQAVERPDGLTTLELRSVMAGGDIGRQISQRLLEGLISGDFRTKAWSVTSSTMSFDIQPFMDAMADSRLSIEKLTVSHRWGRRIVDGMLGQDQLRLIRAAVDSVKRGAPLRVMNLSGCPRHSEGGNLQLEVMVAELAGTGRTLAVI
jgi:hypothetical protein